MGGRLPLFSGEDQKTPESPPISSLYARSEEVPALPSRLSFQEVFDRYAQYLWRALLGLGVPERDVDDACQEVLLVVHRRFAEIDQRTLKSWLYGVCIRVASSHRRKLRGLREVAAEHLPEVPLHETAFDRVAAVRLQNDLLHALNGLDEAKRAAFVLYEIEELTLREIAEALECPLQTAYSRLEAARTHVRRVFAGGEP
jgi:RNA polymerase sigma-70 factor (ECF subfamily)